MEFPTLWAAPSFCSDTLGCNRAISYSLRRDSHWVDAARSPRRDESRHSGRCGKHQACGQKGEWIMRLQTIELCANQTAEQKRQQRSNGKPGAARKNNLSHDHPYDVALQRAESHADANPTSGYRFKNPNGIAEVPLTPLAIQAFQRQITISGDGPFLCPSERNSSGHHKNVCRTWQRTLSRAKVHYFRIYDLRSTYATRLSAGGVATQRLPPGRRAKSSRSILR